MSENNGEGQQIEPTREMEVRDAPHDNVEPTREAPVERRQERAPAAEKAEPPVGSKFAGNRASAVEKLRAQRALDDSNPDFRAMTPEVEQSRAGKFAETREDREQQRFLAENPQVPPAIADNVKPPQTRRLKVNGQEVEVDEEQLTKFAQIGAASEDVLEKAKQTRSQLEKELADIRAAREAHHSAQTPNAAPPSNLLPEDTKPGDTELRALVDRIQVGDPDDAAAALNEAFDLRERRLLDQIGNIEDRVSATIQRTQYNERIKADAEQTLTSFLTENPEFAGAGLKAKVLTDTTIDVMERNLAKIGFGPDQIQNAQKAFNGAARASVIGHVYRQLREQGQALPPHSDVLKAAVTDVRKEFGMPEPSKAVAPAPAQSPASDFTSQRQQRREALSPQPRRANVAPGYQPPEAEKSQEEKRFAAAQQMRMARRGR